jgi:hypothetical protein
MLSERLEVLEMSVRGAEGVNEHDSRRSREPLRREDCSSGAVQELIPNLAGQGSGEIEDAVELRQTRGNSAVLLPSLGREGGPEVLSDLPLDCDANQAARAPCQNKKVRPRGSGTAIQLHLELGDCDQ